MKCRASLFLVAAVSLGAYLPSSQAAEPKPIAAVAVASYNDLIDDINFIGGLADRPNLGAAADGLVSMLTQFKGLAGVDKTRPSGAIVQAGGEDGIVGYVFVPITNFKEALGLLKLYNKVEKEDDIYKLSPEHGSKTTYLKQVGKWACLSDKAEALADVVVDPAAVLRDLEKNYIVSGRVFLSNVPDALRDKFLSGIKDALQKEVRQKKDDESDEQFDLRKKLHEQLEGYLTRVTGDLDQINVGWGLDRKAEKTYLDFSVSAKPGTKTAEEMAASAHGETRFANFRIPDAAAVWAVAGEIPEAKQEIALNLIKVIRGKAVSHIEKDAPQDKRESLKEIAENVSDLFTKIVNSGRVDAVITGLIKPDAATGLGAFYVADGELFDKILHTAVKLIEEKHPEAAQYIKLDGQKVEGHNVHIISVPIPKDAKNRDMMVKLFGERLVGVIAVGKENVYVGAGRDAGEKLKEFAVASGKTGPKPVPPMSICYALGSIASVAAEVAKPGERPFAKMAVAELKKSPGEDHVSLTAGPIANGVRVRLEVQQGVLRLAGRAIVMAAEGKAAGTQPPAEQSEEK